MFEPKICGKVASPHTSIPSHNIFLENVSTLTQFKVSFAVGSIIILPFCAAVITVLVIVISAPAGSDDFANKTYQFTNNKTYSFFDVASILSELSVKEIKYTPIELTAFEVTMKQKGLPEAVIKKMGGFLLDIKNSQEAIATSDLENKLGRKPTSLNEGLKKIFEF